MTSSQRCLVLFHPGARSLRGGDWERLKYRIVARLGAGTIVRRSDDACVGAEIDSLDAAQDFLLVVGGDGTLHHAIARIAAAIGDEREWPRLGLLPAGTANDYARSLAELRGAPCNLESLALAIERGATGVRADLGRVECASAGLSRSFALFSAVGSPCDWVRVADSPWLRPIKRLGATIGYGIASLAVIARARVCDLRIAVDGAPAQAARLFACFVATGRYLGGGLDLGKDVRLDAGRLALLALPLEGRISLVRRFLAARSGSGVKTSPATRVTLWLRGPTVMNLDGELVALHAGGEHEVTLRLLPGKLRWI